VLERAKTPTEVPPEPNPDLTEEIYNRETYLPPRRHQPLLPPAPDNRLRDAMAEAQSRPLPPPLNIERDNRLRDAMAEAQSRPLLPPLNIERVPEY